MKRLRFAPSPTGSLHIGNLRNALFNFLIAKKLDGKLILRIEDTDQKREVEGAAKNLIDIMNWIGINFDEGPNIGGEYGPYTQSKRTEIYNKYIQELLEKDGAYHCFCTPERLQTMREEQQAKKLPPRYNRKCRDLSKAEVEKKIQADEKFVIRQKIPSGGETIAQDYLRGEIKFQNSELDDHVLVKSTGMPTYQFANVVDDYEMKISHIVRGDEWISSLPKNILLYQAFGWTPPTFIHLPLILNKNGGKLSKRDNDTAVEDYRAKGYLPEAIINFCALQGWHPKDEQETFTFKELIEKFNLDSLKINPAIFDIEKLDYLNGWHIRQVNLDELTKLCVPFLEKARLLTITNDKLLITNCNNKITNFDYLKNVVRLEQERMKKLSEIGELTEFFFVNELSYETEMLVWKKMDKNDVGPRLKEAYDVLDKIPSETWTNNGIEEALVDHIKAKEGKIGEYLWPMRVALTGRQASPGPFDIAEVFGKVESLRRVLFAIDKLQ